MFENTYFEYCIDPKADEPIMLILNQIGNTCDDEGNVIEYGINGAQFCKELLMLDSCGKEVINIYINSIGGSVIDGYSILGAMLKTKAKVNTYNIGVAASTAGWLFLAGRTRDMSDYATWMGHNPSATDGSDSEIRRKFEDAIVKITSERTSLSLEETKTMLDKETYLTATECLADGFCDTITATSKMNIKRMKGATTVQDKHKLALEISNIALPIKIKPTTMADITNTLDINITNKLGIDKDASVAMAVKGITELQNALVIEKGAVAATEAALKVVNKEKSDLQKRFDDLSEEMNTVKSKMEAEETENRLTTATDMVNSFATLGKIENKAEIINDWIEDAKVSKEAFDRVKNRLNALPVNKEAKKMEVVNTLTGTGGPKNMAQIMHSVAQKNKQK